MKKLLSIIFALSAATLVLTGCENKKEEKEELKTVASILVKDFEKKAKEQKSILDIATSIKDNEILDLGLMTEELTNKDYLAGFDSEIKGFTKAIAIKPMIGSIPFIAYVFETKDTSALEKELKDNANKRWNICTEADEMEISVVDNYVFFVMSPKSFEEEE